jgi:hypothetical protein
MHFFEEKMHVLHRRSVRFRPPSGLLVSEGANLLSPSGGHMQRDGDISASERLAAIAELLARGIDRLAIQKHDRGRARQSGQEASGAGT